MARQVRLIETIYGNLKGLKSNQIKQLRRLYHQRLPSDRITTSDFAQRLAAISTDIHQPISTYLNRRGQVIRVGVGSPRQTQIPPLELPRYGADRLSGIRCVATTLKQEVPKESALTAMALQRLDALAVLTMTGSGFERRGGGATGYVRSTYLAHLVPDPTTPWTISSPLSLEQLAQQNLMDLVEALESEFGRSLNTRSSGTSEAEQVLMVGVIPQTVSTEEMKANLAEVALLVESAGGVVVETIHQKRSHPHPQTVVGAGKVKEIALRAQTLGVTLIVFNLDLSPSQVRNLETQIGIRIVDRTEVILDIFAQRAQSQAGKLQVELAQLEYMLPRLAGRGQAMSRLGGGIGTRGPGETKLETERRAIQRRINTLQQAVNQLQAHRSRLRQRRQHQRVPSVAVVGYTNAGKSTLLNVLTNAEAYTADQLFATLDPTTRRLSIPDPETHEMRTLVLTDTVGFIHNLPPPLMDAFRATLEEVTDADALLHVVDLSHPDWENHLRSVMDLLGTMPITPGPGLIAFNKMDQVSSEALALAQDQFPQAVFISAQERLGLNTLRHKLLELIDYADCAISSL
ncbi:GTPase HflX [Acaryochloris sp. CCMEE 5410]|uniref:GTPase HflX n=1 Tax=Acaryochloris sp. CCMEE 5410 TaxID=310037 RepID=UPI0002483B44|nr:GTPase HflX [Acaryochloris sp. CCMEE 5410]